MESHRVKGSGPVLGLVAAISGGNALWMLAAPRHWYLLVPADVPDFGPFNPHFVRDLGCAYLVVAGALLGALLRPAWRLPLVGTSLAFFGLHALVHVYDTTAGHVDAHHWWLDFPTSYLPVILLALVLRAECRASARPPATG